MRTTAHGLAVGTKVRVTGAPRRHARGKITRLFSVPKSDGTTIALAEYRSDADASIRLARVDRIHAVRLKRVRSGVAA